MHIKPFLLEEFFAKHEFTVKHLLCASDCEPLHLEEVVGFADTETASLWRDLRLSYTDPKGHPLLRAEIARLYKDVTADDVLVLAPEEGIFLTMLATLQTHDKIIVPVLAYQSLYEIAASLGCELLTWLPHENYAEAKWQFDVKYVCDLMEIHHPKMIVLNFPHNPTCALITRTELEQVVRVAAETGTMLFSDEMYRFLEMDTHMRLPSASDLSENAVSLCGLSKSFALPGLRIGWLTSRNAKLLKQIQQLRDYTTICPPAPSEILAIMALRAKGTILERNRSLIAGNKIFASHVFGVGWREPFGGSVAFIRYHGKEGAKIFCDGLLRSKGVLLAPSSVFGFGDSHFRVGLGRSGSKVGFELVADYIQENR